MRRSYLAALLAGAVLFVLAAGTAAAQSKAVTIPKGTKVEKLGPGSFELTTPDGTVFKIMYKKRPGRVKRDLAEASAVIGDCGISDATGKSIAAGTNGVLKGRPAGAREAKGAPPADYITIDDDVTWLPAVIEFQSLRVFNQAALDKLSPRLDLPAKR
ncbi:MAG TPA: hypothetical protein PLP83_02255 [Candidatus Aminicenantes bacterium]|nr:hypothetical protein [Candidatus Aminicenantes bacterium]